MAWRNLVRVSKEMRYLLRKNNNTLWTRTQPKSNLMPMGGGFGGLFSMSTIKKNWEAIPLVITVAFKVSLVILHTIFRFMRAEDLRLWPGTKMKNQRHSWILEGPPTPTLYLVLNQKWEWPQGLLDALGDGTSGKDEKRCDDATCAANEEESKKKFCK